MVLMKLAPGHSINVKGSLKAAFPWDFDPGVRRRFDEVYFFASIFNVKRVIVFICSRSLASSSGTFWSHSHLN